MGKKSGGKVRVKQLGPKGGGMPLNPLADLAIPPEEQIMIPVKPRSDAGYMVWPMNEMMTMDYDRFPAIYPNYLDSNKTIKMGRRISAKDGVPEPTCMDIHEALASMNIRHVVQPYKGYSRDAESRWDNLGRVLVDLQGAKDKGLLQRVDGIYDLDNVPDLDMSDENESGNGGAGKKKLLKELAQVIKVLPGRQQRLDQKKRRLEEEKAKAAKAEKEAAAKTKTATSSGAGSGGNRKKKGKKKK